MLDKIKNSIKQGVINNKAYTLKPMETKIKLNQNESPYDLPLELKEKITDLLKEKNWNIYPDFTPLSLYEKISNYYHIDPDNILIGNGSNEMIFTILTATLETGKKIIIPEPTFTVYQLIASNLNANIKVVPLNENFSFDTSKIIDEAKSTGSITVLCSPNNPTGTTIPIIEIEKIARESNGIVVIDEAYIHFGGESAIDLVNHLDNLIILRTFSKAFGLAGLRIGMMISHKKIISQLSKVKLPYNLNIFSLTTLEIVFNNMEQVNDNIKNIKNLKIDLENKLKKINGLTLIPSQANFFLVKVNNSHFIYENLLKKGILVRDVSSYPMLKNCLRISVGKEEENNYLIKCLNEILKS